MYTDDNRNYTQISKLNFAIISRILTDRSDATDVLQEYSFEKKTQSLLVGMTDYWGSNDLNGKPFWGSKWLNLVAL